MGAVYIAGHSLGAAEASIYAYSRTQRGLSTDGVYVFGCPRPGNTKLGIALAHVPTWLSIRNAQSSPAHQLDHDLVTDVPFDVPLLGDTYVEPAPFHDCCAIPLLNDPWGPFRYHHIELYQEGCCTIVAAGGGDSRLVPVVDAVADLYHKAGAWDFQHFVDGQYWGGRVMPDGAKLVIARGSTTELDWMHDFESVSQKPFLGALVSAGFLAGVTPAMTALDEWLAS